MIKRIHFIGIAGIGMSAIAIVLKKLDYHITGSDLNIQSLDYLIESGVNIYSGHHSQNIKNSQLIVRSTAIQDNNIEIIAAKEHKIPIISRGQMLAELMHLYYSIAVTGTHGKTTTTSLLFEVFNYANLQPSCIVGGKLMSTNTNAVLGGGKHFIIEADESDASFLHLFPMMAIITNIDYDHMDTYNQESNNLISSFLQFLSHIPFYGCAVLCYEDQILRTITPQIKSSTITYGFNKKADLYATDISFHSKGSSFLVHYPRYNLQFIINSNLLGTHNVLNCLAVIAIALENNIDLINIVNAILHFKGVARRTQYYQINSVRGNLLIDDYGHHPVEIKTTIEGIKKAHSDKKILLVFQPHRYTRTRDLFAQFIDSIKIADQVILSSTYTANEELIVGYDSLALATAIENSGFSNILYASSLNLVPDIIYNLHLANTIVVIMGAGNITSLAKIIADSNNL